jgi:hypothetical protein
MSGLAGAGRWGLYHHQVAIGPKAANRKRGGKSSGTAELPAVRAGRKRRPGLAAILALLGLGGLAVAGYAAYGQLMPRVFTRVQQRQIEAWEVASRWRTIPATRLFPAVVPYRLAGAPSGSAVLLRLAARRLAIARQESCARAAGAGKPLLTLLARDGCQVILRASYSGADSSFVLTVGIAVLPSQASALAAAGYLAHRPGSAPTAPAGVRTAHLVLRPFPVPGTPAAGFGLRQRQFSWVADAGPYLVVTTMGYADGRRRVQVTKDPYTYQEMSSMARGVVATIAAPLDRAPQVPHCPGGPACGLTG